MLFTNVLDRVRRAAHIAFVIATLATLAPSSVFAASSVTLAWNTVANVAGYKVYYGTSSRAYTNTVTVTNATTAIVSNLVAGATYYFAATAYDTFGLESPYSVEVGYTNVLLAPPTITLTSPANNAVFTAPAAINLQAGVAANGHSITKVQFYSGTTLLGEDTISPYAFNWSDVAAGSYSLTARLVYDAGATLDSTPAVNVLVAAPRNSPPTIAAIADQSVLRGNPTPLIPFTVDDAETDASNLTLYASSSDLALVPTNNIVFGGSGSNRTVTITPAPGQSGEADITLTVSDGNLTASSVFILNVAAYTPPPNTAPAISAIADLTINSNTVMTPISFKVGDAETAASNLTVWANSGNLTLVPTNNIVLGGSESNRTVMIIPVTGQIGTANIAITVSDGIASAQSTFQVTVQSAAPTLVIGQSSGGSVSPDLTAQPLRVGRLYSVTAVPDPGQAFVGWSGSIVSSTPKLTFAVKSNVVLTARFAPVTFSTSGVGTISPNLRLSQGLIVGRTYLITAVPGSGQLFAGWSGSITSSTPALRFILATNTALRANFIPNPYFAVQGTYNGLFHEDDAVRTNSSGAFTVAVSSRGSYSGTLRRGTSRLAFSGLLDLQCQATKLLSLNASNALSLQLRVGGADQPDQISGRLTDGSWVSTLSGDRAVFSSRTNPAPYAGTYTLSLPGQDGDPSLPNGDGFGTVQVSSNGLAIFAGTLADGTAFSQSAPLSRQGLYPLYVPLYSGRGSLLSWLAFTNQPNDDFHGLLNWLKPADPALRVYPGGFNYQCLAIGSIYRRPAASTNHVLNLANASVEFSGGNLAADFTNSIVLGLNSLVTNLSSNPLTLSFSLTTGTFKGSATDPASGKALPFSGAVFQKHNAAYGFLLGTNQSSRVSLTP